jgi:beta-glucosidase
MSVFNEQDNSWTLSPGAYEILAGPSSSETPLHAMLRIE